MLQFKRVMNRLRNKPRHLRIHVTAIMSVMLIHKQALRDDQIQFIFRAGHGNVE